MEKLSRRDFLRAASAATLAAAAAPSLAVTSSLAASGRQRVFIGSNTPEGILAYEWDPANGELAADGVAAKLANVDWITYSPDHQYLFAASEVDSFNGQPTGEVASFRVVNGELQPLSARNSSGKGTCHVALDRTGRVLLAADYGGGSAASFRVTDGRLGPAVWTEHYTGHGPNASRQQSAHAHFASFSPDNRFAYINDLGGDCIHIYSLNATTAVLTPAGTYRAKSGAGPRTLHVHPNGHTAYSINELDSTVDVLEWSNTDGGLKLVKRIELLPAGYSGDTHACDTVISKDGKSVYFANRGDNSIYFFHADEKTGSLTPSGRFDCGGKTPRNFVLDPTERWMLVANQSSNQISVFVRNPQTGALAEKGKSFAAAAPMCILFA
ncbi:MAG: lactonase family protein [Terracidiphilus sp.]|jgi:6-phosphogluconolactonase